MPSARILTAFGALIAAGLANAQQYSLQDTFDTTNFFSHFNFFDAPDPTHGFVRYLAALPANDNSLAGFAKNAVFLSVDNKTPNCPSGRNSVRVTSKKTFNTALIVADILHMPEGPGIWPAFWTFGPNWPHSGEIDILEGVNLQKTNAVTLHTGPGCVMTNEGSAEGSTLENGDCNNNNALTGCSQKTAVPFGQAFNQQKGGVFAMDWTTASIAIYYFPRDAIPADLTAGTPNPASWGTPVAKFNGGEGCDIARNFKEHSIIFNTALCGDWAGAVWGQDPALTALAATCEEYVATNPAAFNKAYWLINSVKVYQQGGDGRRDNARQTRFRA